MADALRQLLAEFVVEVDSAGNIAKGEKAVEGLKVDLEALSRVFAAVQAAAKPAAQAVSDVFTQAAASANRAIAAMQAKAFGGRASEDGFFAAGLGQKKRMQGLAAAAAALGGPSGGDGFFSAGQAKAQRDAVKQAKVNAKAMGDAIANHFNRAGAAADKLKAKIGGAGTKAGGGSLLGSLLSLRSAFGALAIGAGARMAKGFIDQIGDIEDAAAKLGVTNAEVQRLSVLAKFGGASVEALGTAFRNVGRAAVAGTDDTQAAFAALGVGTRNADGSFKSRQDLFFETAGALADVSDETKRATLAQRLFGQSGIEILPLLAKGRADLERNREAIESVAVATDEQIKQAAEFGDRWDLATASMRAKLVPVLLRLTPLFEGLLGRVGKGLDLVGRIATAFDAWAQNSRSSEGAIRALKLGLDALLLPLKLLEDLIVFLAGGDSRIGNALEVAFGEGAAASISDGLDALVQGTIDGFTELFAYLSGEQSFEQFGINFMRVTDDMGAALDRFFEKLGSINQRIQEFLGVDGLVDRVQRLAGFASNPIDALRATVGLDAGTRERTGGILSGIGTALSEINTGGIPLGAPAAVGGISGAFAPIQDNRTQSVTVQVGSTAEVAGAVAGAQRGMGRDATAQLAAVSGE